MSRGYKTVGYDQLKNYGINPLTGEACAFSMRILCDLSVKGEALLEDFYGLRPAPYQAHFPKNMNSMVGNDEAVASCMITRGMFKDLYMFILFREGWEVIAETGSDCTGMSNDTWNEVKDAWPGNTQVRRNYRSSSQPHVGSRNVHAFTGRVL